MTNSLQNLSESVKTLEELVDKKLSTLNNYDSSEGTALLSSQLEDLQAENHSIKKELETLKQSYKVLKDTSKEVINELNHSIQVIEDYFNKKNASN